MPGQRILNTLLLLSVGACGDGRDAAREPAADPTAEARPAMRTDTLMAEGTPQEIRLERFDAPDGFPLPFTTYVPAGMASEVDRGEGGEVASVQFVASDGAFVHVVVHPSGTDPQEALGVVKAYSASHGVPVSQGIEPLPSPDVATRMPWAAEAYTFRYQAGGRWFAGTIGLGSHAGRLFHVLHHYPAEYGDSFGPRAALIMETWRWVDGSGLMGG